MERQALTCPVCGAPHRKTVPSGVVQVRCSYCGAAIMVPTNVPRCPNHPDLLATAVCNDCGGSFCRGCLTPFAVGGDGESGTLQLCFNCLSHRRLNRAESVIFVGIAGLILGVLFMVGDLAVGILFILVISVPAFAYGIYSARSSQVAGGTPSENTAVERQKPDQDPHQMYQETLAEYVKSFGVVRGAMMLENRIKAYLNDGFSREEAIKKLAEDLAY